MRRVAVIGVGITEFGELWDSSFRKLGIGAGMSAVSDAKISADQIEALFVGNMSAGRFIRQEHVAALIADYSGIARDHIPATRVEAAGASGGIALRQGFMAVASGLHDIVVVGGAEKMTDVSDIESSMIQSSAADQEWETELGATFPGLHALMATRHMHDYGTTREQLADVAVKNHRHGALNPKAQFRREINRDVVLRSPMVASPLRIFDCAPSSDGAATVVLCPLDMAKEFTDSPVEIVGSGQASDSLGLHHRKDICTMGATRAATERAFKMAGLSQKDVDVAEVHDNFTISEIIAIEDLGFFPKGEGGKATEEGLTSFDGDVVVNTSGGLKARGDPIGATGVAQAVEIVSQLRGTADKRQVKDAEVGLTQNIGGTGATAVVHLFRRV
ncbi:MAG: thiolase domain-containing protein [Candidatus Thermoplasmatota archaeon]|nr:thiolase domain-containing protein [Candidatus Thermoplasmatota archaeon]